jgi:hypothetical protein
MTQALYAHINNKTIKKKKETLQAPNLSFVKLAKATGEKITGLPKIINY